MKKAHIQILLIFAATLSFLSACSKEESQPYVDAVLAKSIEDAKGYLKTATVSCEDKSQCPGHVGGLVYVDARKEYIPGRGEFNNVQVKVCSHQLIAPNKVLTNKHCLPKSIMQKGASCSGLVKVFFPETSQFQAEEVGCVNVEDLSEIPMTEMMIIDWAVLTLDRSVLRSVPHLNKNGLPHGTAMNMYPTYFTETNEIVDGSYQKVVRGQIKKVTCTTKMTSVFAPTYTHHHAPNFFATCDNEIIGGNSGAGVYTQNGLSAVLNMSLKDEEMDLVHMGNVYPIFNHMVAGSNLHCFSYFNKNQSPFCKYKRGENHSRADQSLLRLRAGVGYGQNIEEFRQWIRADRVFNWDYFNFSTISQFYQPEDMFYMTENAIPEFKEYYRSEVLKHQFPFSPTCIASNLASVGKFQAKLPFVRFDQKSEAISNKYELLVPTSLEKLLFQFEYSQASNQFVGQLVRMDGDSLSKYLQQEANLERTRTDCLMSGASPDCQRYDEAVNSVNQYQIQSPLDPSLFHNENLIRKSQVSDPRLILPVCKAAGA